MRQILSLEEGQVGPGHARLRTLLIVWGHLDEPKAPAQKCLHGIHYATVALGPTTFLILQSLFISIPIPIQKTKKAGDFSPASF